MDTKICGDCSSIRLINLLLEMGLRGKCAGCVHIHIQLRSRHIEMHIYVMQYIVL